MEKFTNLGQWLTCSIDHDDTIIFIILPILQAVFLDIDSVCVALAAPLLATLLQMVAQKSADLLSMLQQTLR